MNIKIIGVGGAGSNVVCDLYKRKSVDLNFAVMDTDAADLNRKSIPEKIFLGSSMTKGLSTGGDYGLGKKIAEKEKGLFTEQVQGVDCLFLVTGLGGGTGGAVTPVVADLARKQGTIVIAFVFLPFSMEGAHKAAQSENGLVELRKYSDAVICLPNDLMLQQIDASNTVLEAFSLANEWIIKGVVAIVNSLLKTGIVNLDLNALRKMLSQSGGKTLYSLGSAEGDNAVEEALQNFSMCPLLHTPQGTQFTESLLVNITGGPLLALQDVNKIVTYMNTHFSSKKNSLIGAVIDESFNNNKIEICVIGVSAGLQQGLLRKNVRNRLKENPHQQVLFFDEEAKGDRKAMASNEGGQDVPAADGYFGQVGKILYKGEDLDIPTYLRKGVKVRL